MSLCYYFVGFKSRHLTMAERVSGLPDPIWPVLAVDILSTCQMSGLMFVPICHITARNLVSIRLVLNLFIFQSIAKFLLFFFHWHGFARASKVHGVGSDVDHLLMLPLLI